MKRKWSQRWSKVHLKPPTIEMIIYKSINSKKKWRVTERMKEEGGWRVTELCRCSAELLYWILMQCYKDNNKFWA